jgi:hypothetical protein
MRAAALALVLALVAVAGAALIDVAPSAAAASAERGKGGKRRALRAAVSPAPFPSRLSTADGAIVDSAGAPVALRGFNVLPVWDDHPGRTWSADHNRKIAAKGFNAVRFMLHWNALEPRRGQLDETHLETLDRAIDHARQAGLYVILNPICVFQGDTFTPGWARTGDTLRSIERRASGYVSALAARYRDEPALAAYDLVNEPPTYPPDQNRILRMYGALTAAVRAHDATRLNIVEPSFGNSDMSRADPALWRAIPDAVLSIHDYYLGGGGDAYLPAGDLERTANGTARHTWEGEGTYRGGAAREFEQHLLANLTRMRELGIPMWIGEFGIDPAARGGARWIREKVALYKKHGLGYAWWLYGVDGAWATLDRTTGDLRPFVELLR